jgi:hypothetical protein
VVAELELSADRPVAFAAVRLCEVAPGGASSLIARGVLNLTHREGHDRVVPLTVRIPFQSTAYAVPAGHRLRVAVSPTYWPWIWPSPEPVTLIVHRGRVELPERSGPDGPVPAWGEPESAAGLTKAYARVGTIGRTVHHDLATGRAEVEFPWIDHLHTLTESGTELSERNVAHYRLTEGDPLSAAVAVEVDVGLARGDWRTRVEVRSEMTCDGDRFLVTTALDAYEGDVRRFGRRWSHAIPRDGG